MRKKLSLIFSIFSIFAFLFLILWVGLRSINTRNNNLDIAGDKADQLKESVISGYLAGGGFNSRYLSEQVNRFFANNSEVKAVVVYTKPAEGQETVEYIFAVNADYLTLKPSADGTWKGLPEFQYSSIQEARLSHKLIFPNDFSAEMDTIFLIFGREALFSVLKEALIILLSFLIITAVFLVVAPYVSKVTSSVQTPVERSPHAGDSQKEPELEEDDHVAILSPVAEEIPKTVPAPGSTAEKRIAGHGSKGLYSPDSDLGWEEYLEERLSAELKRAASFDQDLVLLLVSINGLGKRNPQYRAVAEKIREYFNFKDLCFEYGKSGYAVILPNVDLDQGMEKVDSFKKKIDSIITEADPSGGYRLRAGLSARNGRLTSGDRLIREADRALSKAEHERSSVLAFRVDPEKYRRYLAAKT